MKHCYIYFLVDVSESMVGEPIEQVQNGMRTIIQELRVDPYALETAFVSVIAFAGKATSLSPLTELSARDPWTKVFSCSCFQSPSTPPPRERTTSLRKI